MRPYFSNSREASAEFERISLDELPRPNQQPQIQIVPPTEQNPPLPTSLSPSRPIILPRVSLQRERSTGPSSHWRKPSYSRVDSSANPKTDSTESSRQYDEDGGVDPDIKEVQDGLNFALGTGAEIGSWLPTTRQPSFRRAEQTIPAPQIVVEDTGVQDVFEPDERETAGLTVNASEIAGAMPVRRARTLSSQRIPPITTDMLGADLGAVERRGSSMDNSMPTSPLTPDGDKKLTPGGNSVIRHIRKASQRVVNLANAGDEAEGSQGFPFPGSSPNLRPSTREGPIEFPFPSLGAPISPVDKLSTEFSVSETGHSPFVNEVELRGKSLGIFGPDNWFRNWLCNILLHSYVHRLDKP
jgi:hypothetical protein